MKNEEIERLQELEKEFQASVLQKHQFQVQLNEINFAIEELKNHKEGKIYYSAGPIMVEKTKEEIEKELKEKKERLELRLNVINRREEKLKNELNSLYQKYKDEYGKKD